MRRIIILSTLIYLCLFVDLSFEKEISLSKLLPSRKLTKYSYETKYFDTFVDHFSYTNYSATFKMRYLISQSHWRPGNAILFYCGNEGSIDVFADNSGFIWELGEQLSAMVVFAEHRYYGTSLPFGDKSFSVSGFACVFVAECSSVSQDPTFFGYLSAEQALADYASLITFLKGSIVGADRSAVVAFGGSYGGMLAAWFRQKYPNIVAGSLAASAPVLMVDNITNCNNAYRVLTFAYTVKGSPACVRNVRRFWPILAGLNTAAGLANLTKIFRTCQPLVDVSQIQNQVSEALFDMGMANYPYPANFLAPMPAWPVTAFCKSLDVDKTQPYVLLEAIRQGIQVYFNYTGETKCLPMDELSSPGLDASGWSLQTCTELPIPLCSDGVTDMFYKNDFNRSSNDAQCLASFKVKPRWGWGRTLFWGNRLNSASNIIFSNGLLDPWSAGGVYSTLSDSIKIIRIPNGAHHLDLRESHQQDPPDVLLARKIEKMTIEKWIAEWNQ